MNKQRAKIDTEALNARGVKWGEMPSYDIASLDDGDMRDLVSLIWTSASGSTSKEAMASLILAEQARRSSEKSGRQANCVAFIALFISLLSFAVSVFGYIEGNKSQAEALSWMRIQYRSLQEIEKNTSGILKIGLGP